MAADASLISSLQRYRKWLKPYTKCRFSSFGPSTWFVERNAFHYYGKLQEGRKEYINVDRPFRSSSLRPRALISFQRLRKIYKMMSFFKSFVLLVYSHLCFDVSTVRCNMICILLKNREDNHLKTYQNILNSFVNMLHIQPEMMRLNDADSS